MKVPQWIFKKVHASQHPADALKDAARVLDMEAAWYRKERNTEAARALKRSARALRDVAAGQTWAEAFEIEDTPASAANTGESK